MLINSKLNRSYLFENIHFSYLEKELEIMTRTGFWTQSSGSEFSFSY